MDETLGKSVEGCVVSTETDVVKRLRSADGEAAGDRVELEVEMEDKGE